MKKVLFIGRFQPFHIGHLSVLKDIDSLNNVSKIIIGVGSSQYSGTEENPYSFAERRDMLETVLAKELKKEFKIFAIPDVHDNNIWVDHIKKIIGDFDQVCTGNKLVKRLFEEKRYPILPVKKVADVSGTQIRQMMAQNDYRWKESVPQIVISLLEK